jgi:hypothetical protein
MQNFYNGKVTASSSRAAATVIGTRSVTLNLNDNVKIDLDNSLKLKLKLKLKSPRRGAPRKDPPAGTSWNLVGIGPDGSRYASAFDGSGNASVSLPTNKILSLYVEEIYSGYTNAMLLSYPDGGVSFRNGPSTAGTTDAIALGTPAVTNGLCTAPVQPDSNICTSGSGIPDAAVYTNIDSMDRYGAGVLDIYSVLDANQDGIPDAYEMGSGMLTKPAFNSGGNIGFFSSTNTNSPATVLALTVDPNTAAYTNAPAWTNAQVRFALDTNFINLRTNYLPDWSNSVVTVALAPAFTNSITPVLLGNWSNAAAAVATIPAFTNLVPASLSSQLTNMQAAVSTNAVWAALTNSFNNSSSSQTAQLVITINGASGSSITETRNFTLYGNIMPSSYTGYTSGSGQVILYYGTNASAIASTNISFSSTSSYWDFTFTNFAAGNYHFWFYASNTTTGQFSQTNTLTISDTGSDGLVYQSISPTNGGATSYTSLSFIANVAIDPSITSMYVQLWVNGVADTNSMFFYNYSGISPYISGSSSIILSNGTNHWYLLSIYTNTSGQLVTSYSPTNVLICDTNPFTVSFQNPNTGYSSLPILLGINVSDDQPIISLLGTNSYSSSVNALVFTNAVSNYWVAWLSNLTPEILYNIEICANNSIGLTVFNTISSCPHPPSTFRLPAATLTAA